MDNLHSHSLSESESIIRQIVLTKKSISKKFEQLQGEMATSFKAAEDSVRETVQVVKDTVSFDNQIQQHPIAYVSASIVAGVCLGQVIAHYANSENISVNKEKQIPKSNGVVQDIFNTVKDDVTQIRDISLGMFLGTLREMAKSTLPNYLSEKVGEVFDATTKHVGGRVLKQ